MINQPNVAILGLGAIEKRPVVIDDAIAIRSMVYLTLSYDHRAVDGAIAHQFMGHVNTRSKTGPSRFSNAIRDESWFPRVAEFSLNSQL